MEERLHRGGVAAAARSPSTSQATVTHTTATGMLTPAQLREAIEQGEIDTVLTVFPDM